MSDTTERLAPQFSASLTQTLSLRNERLFLTTIALAVAPLWFSQNLPMIDLPQHAAQVTALREVWAGNEMFTRDFYVNWLTPYLLGYLLLYLLSAILPIATATQLLVTLSVATIPILTGSLLRAAGADERWKWLAIPGSFSFAFYWGFLSYLVAVPLGLLFLILTIRFVAAPSRARAAGIAAFAILLFFCHVIVLGAASVMALGYVLGRHYRDWRTLVLRALPYMAPLPLIALWIFDVYSREASVQSGLIIYGTVKERLLALLYQPSGREAAFPLTSFVVTGSIIVLPALLGARFSRRPERWLPFALGLGLFFAMPALAMGTAYLYHRLGVFLVPLWLLAWDAPSEPAQRRADWLAMAVILLWAFGNIGRFAAFARETEMFDEVVAKIEPGRRVASLLYDKNSPLFALPVYLHFPAWYQAEQAGIVDFNFGDFLPQMVRYREDVGPRITEAPTWQPEQFQWFGNGGPRYDYFIVKANSDVSAEIFKDKLGAVELVAHSGWWWLYRNNERGPVPRLRPVVKGST